MIATRVRDRLRGLARQLRLFVSKRAVEGELDEEVAFHIEMETARNVAKGMTPAAARRQARVHFGGVDWHKEAVRDARWTRGLEDLAQDLRYALRTLGRTPVLTAVAILTVGLGVGATTAVFSGARAILGAALPVADGSRLYTVAEDRYGMTSDVVGHPAIPYPRYEAYQETTRDLFSGLAAHRIATIALQYRDESAPVIAALTSGNYFQVLGLRPAVGGFYARDDEPTVVLSYDLWRSRFGADAAVIGLTLQIDSRPLTVIGVAPPEFTGISTGIPMRLWIPIRGYARDNVRSYSDWVVPFGRLAPGVIPTRAEAGITAAAVRIPPGETQTKVRGARLHRLTGLPEMGRPAVQGFMGMLLGTAGLILFITAANIAGVLFTRAMARRRELAVRLAIGAGRGRLMRQLLTEAVVLFLAGGLIGVVLAIGLGKAIAQVHLPLGMVIPDFEPDLPMLAFGLFLACITGLAFGVMPAVRASRPDLVPALKEAGSSETRKTMRGRGVFVSIQLTFTVVLLVTAGLFVRTLQKALAVDPGFDPDNVVIATTNLAPHRYDEVRVRMFYARLLEEIRSTPGVEAAALASYVQLGVGRSRSDARGSGAGLTERTSTNVTWNRADEAYLTTLRGTLVAGRWFNSMDRPGAPRVVVINETAAARLWPGRSPLGGRLHMMGGPDCCDVVGVVRDGKYATVQEEPVAYAFFAYSQWHTPRMVVHVRSRLGTPATIALIREQVRELDRNVAVEETMPLTQMTGISLLPQRFAATLVGSFGAIGLLLSCIGLYGVLAHDVTQRKRELGIRMALGARSAHVLRLVMRRAGVLVALGCLAGLGIAAMVTGFLRSFLYQVEPLDPVTFAAVPMLLAIVAVLASYAPARRAVRINPQEALRAE